MWVGDLTCTTEYSAVCFPHCPLKLSEVPYSYGPELGFKNAENAALLLM